MCVGMCNTTSSPPVISPNAYDPPATLAPHPGGGAILDSKLEELCKDWLYNRNRAYKLGKEGDQAGSARASLAMRSFMKDLETQYPEKAISETIERLEKGGYKAGF